MTDFDPMWVLFEVPCPTPDGQSAQDLYQKRVDGITPEMRASAAAHGCTFHRAWYAADGSAFYALAHWSRAAGPARSSTSGRSTMSRARSPSASRATSASWPSAARLDGP